MKIKNTYFDKLAKEIFEHYYKNKNIIKVIIILLSHQLN